MFIFFHFLTAIIFEHNIAFEYVDYILYSIPCPLIFSAFHRPVLDQFLNFVILFAFNCGFQEQYNIYLQLWLGLEIVQKKIPVFFISLHFSSSNDNNNSSNNLDHFSVCLQHQLLLLQQRMKKVQFNFTLTKCSRFPASVVW